jgi:hypothetical protein
MAAFTTEEQNLVEGLADSLVLSLEKQGVLVKTLEISVSAEVEVPAQLQTLTAEATRVG